MEGHGGSAGGHYARYVTTQKNLREGLWWSTLHQDLKAHCKAYDISG